MPFTTRPAGGQNWHAAACNGLLGLLLAWTAGAASAAADSPVFTPMAHSADAVLEGSRGADSVVLRLRRGNDTAPLAVSELTASLGGRALTPVARGDGSWVVPLPAGARLDAPLQVQATHDGIREVLDGSLSGAAARPAGAAPAPPRADTTPAAASAAKSTTAAANDNGRKGIHSQMLWWVLNIAIVLIAALAISKRSSR
ncbi:MAG: hypothetical protein JSR67_00325 [Proteobacteria bacterium]|nr:hypothetical protein [Pseudomonadota bacterium]